MRGQSILEARRGIARAVIVGAAMCALWLLGAPAAFALPGDPPIEPLTPADGAVLAPDPGGVLVTFTCPEYAFADAGGGLKLFGGKEYYSLRVTTSPQLDADGRLASAFSVDQATASSDPARPAGECFSGFSDGSASGVHTKPGTYYWQVARICTACGGYEVSAVRSFRIAVQATPRVGLASRAYAGYAVVANVQAEGAPDGASVSIQRESAGTWSELAAGTLVGGAAALDVTLPKAGPARIRAVVVVGDQRLEGEPTAVSVGGAGKRTVTAKSYGQWRGKTSSGAAVTFRIRPGGTEIRDFGGKITALCPAAVPGQFIPQLEVFAVPRARLAPDGRFLTTVPDGKQRVRIAGQIKGRRVVGGQINWTDGLCTGSGTFTAKR